jgi:type II secretory pathway component GspD/PulD (secretin)
MKILESLSQQISLELVAMDLSTELSRREVDVSFSDASLDELLAKLGQASGLQISVEGPAMKVRASDP